MMDSFALPVQGTETRVNTLESANEYMVEYTTIGEKVIFHLVVDIRISFPQGWGAGEYSGMVSLSSWLWLLAVWYRRHNPIDTSEISRSFCGRCGEKFLQNFLFWTFSAHISNLI